MWPASLYTTMQWQQPIPRTHPEHHVDFDDSTQVVSCRFQTVWNHSLCSKELGKRLLNHSDAPVLWRPEVIIFLSSLVSLLEVLADFESVNELLDIIRNTEFYSHLFSTQITDLKRCLGICDRIVITHKLSWPIVNKSTGSHEVFTLPVIVQSR